MHDPGMEARIERLEQDSRDMRATLGRIEPMIVSIHAQMPFLATKTEVEAVRGDLGAKIEEVRGELGARVEGVRGELARKPGFAAMWSMGIALFALTMAAMSAGAIFLPLAAQALRVAP